MDEKTLREQLQSERVTILKDNGRIIGTKIQMGDQEMRVNFIIEDDGSVVRQIV